MIYTSVLFASDPLSAKDLLLLDSLVHDGVLLSQGW